MPPAQQPPRVLVSHVLPPRNGRLVERGCLVAPPRRLTHRRRRLMKHRGELLAICE
jgi:hypothetical protein